MPDADRARAAVRALVEQHTALLTYAVPRTATVVQQRTDGSLDLKCDSDPRKILPDVPGLVSVPAQFGLPAVTSKVRAGSRCILIFANADPKDPRVVSWESSAVVDEIVLGAGGVTAKFIREGDVVAVGSASGAIVLSSPGGKTKGG